MGGGIEHKAGLEGAAAENGGPESLRQAQPFLEGGAIPYKELDL